MRELYNARAAETQNLEKNSQERVKVIYGSNSLTKDSHFSSQSSHYHVQVFGKDDIYIATALTKRNCKLQSMIQ